METGKQHTVHSPSVPSTSIALFAGGTSSYVVSFPGFVPPPQGQLNMLSIPRVVVVS